MLFYQRVLTTLCLSLTFAVPALAQGPGPGDGPPRGPRSGGPGGPGGGDAPVDAKPKPYDQVITKEAVSTPGLFTVHRIGEKVYFEIPADQLGKEMLWVTEIEQLPPGLGYGGQAVGNRVIRWMRRNNTIYLRNVDYSIRADEKLAVHQAITDASLEPIIMAFPVAAEGKDKSAVIDVTKLFTSDPPEFAAKNALGAGSVDSTRSYIDTVKSFPTNIETRSLLTFSGSAPSGSPFGGPPTPGRRPGGGGRPRGDGSLSATIHYSMVRLPDTPMMGRLSDSRVGYFSEDFQDYGTDKHRVVEQSYITRYRLEKKDPTAALSEPVKPIVYYIGREVPEKWKPYMKKAVEDWNVAFEQAGFKNAIIAKDAPTVQEDPDWSEDDARYSVIRWAPSETENAMGPEVHDPRSGEILEAHIIVWHNVLKLAEDWYFTQASPMDKTAQKLPLPDELMGRIIEYVVGHEVGHTFGLEHNFKASSAYSIAQLRDPNFTTQYGDEASIMDYGRFNYVAQPGDGARLIPMIGPYDKFAIQWGYAPIPSAKTPEDEKPTLNKMAAEQVTNPLLRFGHGPEEGHNEDPTERREDLSNDPMEATILGLKNIDRVTTYLVPATTKLGEDYDLLSEEYDALLGQRQLELGHVAALIGGVVKTDWHVGYGDDVYAPVPRTEQAHAMQFLLKYGFTTPHSLLRPDILYRIEPSGVANRVLTSQTGLLSSLLSDDRVNRMLDSEALAAKPTYTVMQMVADLQTGLWSELSHPHPVVDLYRRNLQRAYLRTVQAKLNPPAAAPDTTPAFGPPGAPAGPPASQGDLRPILLGQLRMLEAKITKALPTVQDPATRLHLLDAREQIHRLLNPRA